MIIALNPVENDESPRTLDRKRCANFHAFSKQQLFEQHVVEASATQ